MYNLCNLLVIVYFPRPIVVLTKFISVNSANRLNFNCCMGFSFFGNLFTGGNGTKSNIQRVSRPFETND